MSRTKELHVDIYEVGNRITQLISGSYADYLDSSLAMPAVICGSDYSSLVKKPAILVVPTRISPEMESQRMADCKIEVQIAIFLEKTGKEDPQKKLMDYLSALISLVLDNDSCEGIYDITMLDQDIDMTVMGSSNLKIASLWVECTVSSEIE